MKRRSRIGKIKGKGATVLPWMEMFLKRAVVELHIKVYLEPSEMPIARKKRKVLCVR